jgi:hypothetical protein
MSFYALVNHLSLIHRWMAACGPAPASATVAEVVRGASRWIREETRRVRAAPPPDATVLWDLEGLGTLCELPASSLWAECLFLDHRVGFSDCAEEEMAKGWVRYLSVRNSKGRPVFTIEVRALDPKGLRVNDGWIVCRIVGKHGYAPGLRARMPNEALTATEPTKDSPLSLWIGKNPDVLAKKDLKLGLAALVALRLEGVLFSGDSTYPSGWHAPDLQVLLLEKEGMLAA